MGKSEAGKKGIKAFYKKFYSDEDFRNRVIEKRRLSQRKYKKQRQKIGHIMANNFWKRYRSDVNFRNKMLKLWERRAKNPKKNKINVLSSTVKNYHKAIISSYLMSDGSIEKSGYQISFYPDSIEMANLFNNSFKTLYGETLPVKLHKGKKYYILRTRYKLAVIDLLKLGKYGSLEWKIPYKILDSRIKRIAWLRCFFDAEAYVSKHNIVIQSVNKHGLLQIRKLLNSLGIHDINFTDYVRKQKTWNKNYILYIRKGDLIKYRKIIGFNHAKKQEKLDNIAKVAEPGLSR